MTGTPDLRDVLEHLRREYAGVFDEPRLQRHVEDYLGSDLARRQVHTVEERVPNGGRILDVGCGYGSFVRQAAGSFAAVGVDVAMFELRYAAGTTGSPFVKASGTRLPFPPGSFDAVTMWNVLEHVPEMAILLAEVKRVLRTGGTLFLTAPNYAAVRREAHYGLWWPPLLRKQFATAYLRARRRDAAFFRDHVYPCTNAGVRRELRRLEFSLIDLTAEKLADPAAIASGRRRSAAEWIHRLRLVHAVEAVLRAHAANPLKGSIELAAVKGSAPWPG